jgi:hypothetical protein
LPIQNLNSGFKESELEGRCAPASGLRTSGLGPGPPPVADASAVNCAGPGWRCSLRAMDRRHRRWHAHLLVVRVGLGLGARLGGRGPCSVQSLPGASPVAEYHERAGTLQAYAPGPASSEDLFVPFRPWHCGRRVVDSAYDGARRGPLAWVTRSARRRRVNGSPFGASGTVPTINRSIMS